MPPRHEYDAVPDVSHEEHLSFMEGDPEARTDARNCRRGCCSYGGRIAFLVVVAAMLGGVMVMMVHDLRQNSMAKEIQAAQLQVRVTGDGSYSVEYSTPTPKGTTFAELADIMLPPWYEASLMAVDTQLQDKTMTPENVKGVRKALSMTRNLLDAFSPVFPKHSLWKQLRKRYADGYDLVGYYQDLYHSGIDYTDALLQERKDDVLNWKADFEVFRLTNNVRRLVYHPEHKEKCKSKAAGKSSHLFWADLKKVPCGSDLAMDSLQELGRVQLYHAADYFTTIQAYDTIVAEERELNFHNLRKELRIFGDEYSLFEANMIPHPDLKSMAIMDKAQSMLGHINDLWTGYHIYQTHDTHLKEQEVLVEKMATSWSAFLAWADKEDLAGVIKSVLATLN